MEFAHFICIGALKKWDCRKREIARHLGVTTSSVIRAFGRVKEKKGK